MTAGESEADRAFRDRFIAARQSMQARLAAIPLAYSTDGRIFGY